MPKFPLRRYMQAELQLNVAAKADTEGARRFAVAKDRYVIGKMGIGELYIAQAEKDAALNAYVQAIRAYSTLITTCVVSRSTISSLVAASIRFNRRSDPGTWLPKSARSGSGPASAALSKRIAIQQYTVLRWLA